MEDEDQYQFGRYGLQRNPLYSKREDSITMNYSVDWAGPGEQEREENAPLTVEQLRQLTALQAQDQAIWDQSGVRIETAYVQQALRHLTRAIEGEWTFEQAKAAIEDCLS